MWSEDQGGVLLLFRTTVVTTAAVKRERGDFRRIREISKSIKTKGGGRKWKFQRWGGRSQGVVVISNMSVVPSSAVLSGHPPVAAFSGGGGGVSS